MGLNLFQGIGNLGAEPEMRFLPSGEPVTNFRVAISERYTNNDGEEVENTEWIYCTAFRKLAENVNKYCIKGQMVYIQGKLKTRSYEDKDHIKRFKTELMCNMVQFLSKGASDLDSPDAEHIEETDREKELQRKVAKAGGTTKIIKGGKSSNKADTAKNKGGKK